MNVISILVAALVAYIVYIILNALALPSPFPIVVALLVFISGIYGGNRWGRF